MINCCPHCSSCPPLRLHEPLPTTVQVSRIRGVRRQKELPISQDMAKIMMIDCHHNKSLPISNIKMDYLVKGSVRSMNKTRSVNLPTTTKHQSNRPIIRHATIQQTPFQTTLPGHCTMLVYISLVLLVSRFVESVPTYIADQGSSGVSFVNPSYPNPLSAFPPQPVIPTSSSCPLVTVCQCKWSNNKQSALCEKRNLANIPSQLPQDTQVLDMNGNSLNQLAPHIFQDKRLNNLQKIYLSECKISFIADDAFSHLTNLIELDLSHNHLQHVPVKSFEQLNHSLRKLSLAYNQIQTIEPDSFASISHLTNLDLSNNQLSQLKVNAFAGLNQLKELKLHDNRLTQLPINIVEVFPDYLLLDLFSNPWHCDCELRQSIDYLTRHHVQQSIQPSCSTPTRHKDIRWPNVRSDEFLCPPVVINKQNELVVGAGSNVSLACTARGSSPLTFVWFQDEKNMTSPKPNNHSDSAPSSTKLLEERRYEIAEELGPISQPNITTSVLYLFNLELTDTSMFFCWVENAAGYTMANYSLIVNDSPPAQLTPSGFSNGGIFRSFWLSLGETQMGLLSIAFIILLTAAIIFLLMFKQSNRSSKSSQSSDMKQSKGHQHNMPQIETISSSNKFSSVNNQHLTDTDDEEDDDDDDDDDDTDRSSSGSGNSCRKNLKVIAASDLDGFIEHMRSGIINMDYHSMSPVIQFNNASKDKRSQEQQQQQRQQSMIDQQHHHHYHQQLAQQQHLNHQQQPPYLDSTSQVNLNPHHLHHHHFQSASNASSIPYYSQNNINGSTSMATTTSDLSPASSSVSNTNFAQPAPITNCDLQQHQLTDPSMVAPATNTTTTSYTSDYQSGYSEDPSLASNMMPPMYYETLDPASYHPTAGNLYNGALIIGQTSSATGTLLRHPQQQQQQQQQLLLQDMAHNGRTIQNGSQRIQMDSRFRIL